ncbi:MAG TPA: gamma carbonic anhydrase family protein [Kofleriaceae bacterium]|nr:gamma carbonic anhydrase family protein [Kofleriaceae bacterium]
MEDVSILRAHRGHRPKIGDGTFIAETAVLVGDVEVGARSSIWYGAVLRGDVFHIRIGDEVSIQDNTVVHVTGGEHPTIVEDRVTVGHGVILHGCTVRERCIIGMGAIVMDRARIGRQCIVGAGALVTPGTDIPDGHLVIGSPARPKRALSAEELAWIESSADHYVDLAAVTLAEPA